MSPLPTVVEWGLGSANDRRGLAGCHVLSDRHEHRRQAYAEGTADGEEHLRRRLLLTTLHLGQVTEGDGGGGGDVTKGAALEQANTPKLDADHLAEHDHGTTLPRRTDDRLPWIADVETLDHPWHDLTGQPGKAGVADPHLTLGEHPAEQIQGRADRVPANALTILPGTGETHDDLGLGPDDRDVALSGWYRAGDDATGIWVRAG